MKLCDKEKATSYEVWLGKIENERKGINFKEGYVPAKYIWIKSYSFKWVLDKYKITGIIMWKGRFYGGK